MRILESATRKYKISTINACKRGRENAPMDEEMEYFIALANAQAFWY